MTSPHKSVQRRLTPKAKAGQGFERRYVCLGRFGRPYAVRGWIKFTPFCKDAQTIPDFESVVLEDGEHANQEFQSCKVTKVQPSGKYWIAKIEGIDSPERAKQLSGRRFGISAELLPEPEPDSWYVRDLLSMKVVTQKGKLLGKVRAVENFGAGDILVVGTTRSDLRLPFSNEVVIDVSTAQKKVTVDLIPGILEDDEKQVRPQKKVAADVISQISENDVNRVQESGEEPSHQDNG